MAYISYNNLWEIEVSKRDKLQDSIINQLKLKVHDSYRKDEKITTKFYPIKIKDVTNKAYLDENLIKINGHLSFYKKITKNLNYNRTNNL